jgi:predicted 3-demethylubiquinone-9 3-methyltransferase (glyoxalase superfamily)
LGVKDTKPTPNKETTMSKITTFLTYVDQAEAAAKLYTSIFPRSRILSTNRYGKGAPVPEGTVMTVQFELDGQTYTALNGGPHFKFSEAISLVVSCDTQAEIDAYSDKLISGGGAQGPCGWVTDRFGVSWQIIPAALPKLMSGDPARSARVMQSLMTMKKLDLHELERAYEG